MTLTDLERRVLGHLPPWRTSEDAAATIAEETAAGGRSIVSYTLPELTARISKDPASHLADGTAQTGAEIVAVLKELEAQGLAHLEGEDWTMTQAGLEALLAPPAIVPPDHDLNRITSMVDISESLVAAGFEPGSNEFNRAGGLDRDGFKAWRAACGASEDPAVLDALEAKAPAIPVPVPETPAAPAAPAEEAPHA